MARQQDSASTPTTAKSGRGSKTLWTVFGRVAAIAAGLLSLRAVNLAWRLVTGRKAPATPENPEVTIAEAAVWAVLSGAAAQLAKLVVTRRAVSYWVRSTGELPPGVKPSEVSTQTRKGRR